MTPPSQTSLTLLMRVQNGDNDAWERLMEIYGPVVFEQCRRRGLSDEDASDVTQEVFVAVSGSLARFRRDRPGHRFLHWLRTIASRKIADFWRQQDAVRAAGGTTARLRVEQLPEEDDLEWSADEIQQAALRRAVELMKTDFEESTWQAFWMTVIEERATDEVASLLGMSPGAVRQAKYKVGKRLREELLGDLLDNPPQ